MTRVLAVAAALAATLTVAASASGSTIVGSTLPAGTPQMPAGLSCFHTDDCALVPATLAAGNVSVPSDGVITAFHAKIKTYAYLRFRVDRGSFAQLVPATNVYRSDEHYYTVPNSGIQVFTENVRVPVLAGDRVGIDGGPGNWEQTVAGSSALFGAGAIFHDSGIHEDNFEALVNALVEPDADDDGYGDETQDCQPANPAQHTPCNPPPPDPKPPVKKPPPTGPIGPLPKITFPPNTTNVPVADGSADVDTNCAAPPGSSVVCSGAHATYAGTGPGALGGVLSTGGGIFAQLAKAKKTPPKVLKIGSAKFRIAAGKHKLVKIKLSRRARHALAKHGKLKVLLVTTVKLGAGKVRTTRRNITLRPAKTHVKKKR